jgi:hypothetical protein
VNSAVRNFPKPRKRIRDSKALRDFHAANPRCILCGSSQVEAHHILSRAQGGDDVRQNLIALCHADHMALHGQPYREEYGGKRITPEIVRRRIGTWILSEEGIESAWYLTARLGTRGSVAFVESLGARIE